MNANLLTVGIALGCAITALGQESTLMQEYYQSEGGAEKVQQMTMQRLRFNTLCAQLEGWDEASSNDFILSELEDWEHYSDFEELVGEVELWNVEFGSAMNSGSFDVLEASIDKHNRIYAQMNELLMDYLGLDEAGLQELMAGQEPEWESDSDPDSEPDSQPDSEKEPGVYEFSTANISMIGDTAAVDELRFRLQNIQRTYDAISSHVASLNFDLSRSNAENLYSSLAAAGDDAAALSGEYSFTVRFTGLPTDEAMSRYNELEKKREENHLFYQNVVQRIDDINGAIEERDRALINSVCTAACESFMSWSSVPEWYEIPQTFLEWEQQSREHAGQIGDIMDFIRSLGEMRAELRRIKDESMDYHDEMVEEMSDLEPVVSLHAELESAIGSMGWASYTPVL